MPVRTWQDGVDPERAVSKPRRRSEHLIVTALDGLALHLEISLNLAALLAAARRPRLKRAA